MIYEEAVKNIEVQKILSYHAKRIKNLVSSEELKSEKEMALCRTLSTFEPEKKSFILWLGVCCKYYFMERYRQIKSTKLFCPLLNEPGYSKDTGKVKDVLFMLSDLHRDILTYKYINGYSHKEIKELLNLSRDSYVYQLNAAKAIFRELYQNL